MIYTDGVHLVGTNEQELHSFAESIGLKRSWYQTTKKNSNGVSIPNEHPHYDVFGQIKNRALEAGAQLIKKEAIIFLFQMMKKRKELTEKINVNDHYIKQIEKIDWLLSNLHNELQRVSDWENLL